MFGQLTDFEQKYEQKRILVFIFNERDTGARFHLSLFDKRKLNLLGPKIFIRINQAVSDHKLVKFVS